MSFLKMVSTSAYQRNANVIILLIVATSSLVPTSWSFSLLTLPPPSLVYHRLALSFNSRTTSQITTKTKSCQQTTTTTTTTTTVLHGRKTRRGVLGNNVDIDNDGNVKLISNKMKQNKLGSVKTKKSNVNSSSSNNGEEVGSISPLLAEWGATAESSSSTQLRKDDIDNEADNDGEIDNILLQGDNYNSRNIQMQQLLQSIDTTITTTTNFNIPQLVSDIVSLTRLGSSSSTTTSNSNDRVLLPKLKSLLSKDTPTSYRLAWVGSDDAICHIGTSLHKVPLARLQEVYLSLGGGGSVVSTNKWELVEVIRILGPFPNVRNTLRGNVIGLTKQNSNSNSMREGVRLEIAYSSMIDGTGREIIKSTDGPRKVDLDVWFANDKAIVCTVPSSLLLGKSSGSGDSNNNDDDDEVNPFGNGSNILYFVAEDDLDGALNRLRAA